MARPGQPILPSLTADWYNKTTQRNNATFTGGEASEIESDKLYVYVRNTSTTAYERYAPIGLGALRQSYGNAHIFNESNLLLDSASLNDNSQNKWGVLQEPLEGRIGAIAKVLVAGRTWVKVPDTYVANSPSLAVVGTTVTGNGSGKAAVIVESTYGSPTKKIVLAILANNPGSVIYQGKAPSGGIAGITSGGQMTSATVQRYRANTSGLLSVVSGVTDTVWNPGGRVAGNAWISYALTADGIYEVLVEACNNIVSS